MAREVVVLTISIDQIRGFMAKYPDQAVPREYAEVLLGMLDDATSSVRVVPDDDEIQAWANRHDLKGGITDLRCAFEDAESWEAP